MPSRRSVLLGTGALIAGGGAVLGTGAFTTVQAERTVSVETADDASAFLSLTPASGPNGAYADGSGDTLQITLDGSADGNGGAQGLNQNAITTIENIVTVANNGTQEVTSLTLEFTTTPQNVDPNATFDFLVGDQNVDNGNNILTGNNSVPSSLSTGSSVDFGIEVDLINGGEGNTNDLPQNGTYTLTITAETSNS